MENTDCDPIEQDPDNASLDLDGGPDSDPLSEVPEGFTEVGPDAEIGEDLADVTDNDEELVTDAQVDTAAEELSQMEDIQPEQWQNLDMDERLSVVRGIEARMAEIQDRPSVEVTSAALDPGNCGGYVRGEGITLSEEHLASDDVAEIVDTVVHEGRHAYQDHLIQNPESSHDRALTETWAENWDHYLLASEYGQEIYQGQPIESDAWAYAGRIREQLFGGTQP